MDTILHGLQIIQSHPSMLISDPHVAWRPLVWLCLLIFIIPVVSSMYQYPSKRKTKTILYTWLIAGTIMYSAGVLLTAHLLGSTSKATQALLTNPDATITAVNPTYFEVTTPKNEVILGEERSGTQSEGRLNWGILPTVVTYLKTFPEYQNVDFTVIKPSKASTDIGFWTAISTAWGLNPWGILLISVSGMLLFGFACLIVLGLCSYCRWPGYLMGIGTILFLTYLMPSILLSTSPIQQVTAVMEQIESGQDYQIQVMNSSAIFTQEQTYSFLGRKVTVTDQIANMNIAAVAKLAESGPIAVRRSLTYTLARR